jgi:hypothetical protein
MGARIAQMSQDHFADPFEIVENFIIPESQDTKALPSQIRIADRVVMRLSMLPAVHLNDQTRFDTHEIRDVRADGALPSELSPHERAITQLPPEDALDVRHLTTQLPGEAGLLAFTHRASWSKRIIARGTKVCL